MRATMDLIAIYNYNPDVLELLELPEDLDRGTVITNLLMETAELEILYPQYDFLRTAIGEWSKKQLPVWNKLAETLNYEYEPLWNKDYHTSHTETRNLRGTEDISRNLDDDNTFHGTGSGQDLNSVYGFNSSSEAPAEKNTASSTNDSTDNRDVSETVDRDTTDTGTVNNETWERGNIGVLSTQNLIEQEREVDKFNLTDYIINEFKLRFCLGVY